MSQERNADCDAGSIADISTALEVLLRLSETCGDGRLRDSIASVRSALWDELDRPTSPGGQS